jgi:prevent-host-death family protein
MRAAYKGPVFITDRGRTTHVLLTAEEYERLITARKSVADFLAMPEAATIAFEPPRLRGNIHKRVDRS